MFVLIAVWRTRERQRIVEIVDLASAGAASMSEADDSVSFEQEVENARENEGDGVELDSQSVDQENQIEARMRELEQQAEQSAHTPLYIRLSEPQQGVLWFVSFFIIGLLGALANPTQPILAFLILGGSASTIMLLTATKGGVAFRKEVTETFREEMAENAQGASSQQQKTNMGETTSEEVICPNCGWKNPERNSYCHDCGEALSDSNE